MCWRAAVLTALAALAGCASTGRTTSHDLGTGPGDGGKLADAGKTTDAGDAGRAGDGGPPDAAGVDLSGQDLASPGGDAAKGADQAVAGDLAVARDLSVPSDLAALPDLVPPPDLAGTCVAQTQPCDVICQNCPNGQKCGASTGVQTCEPPGNVPDGQPCGANMVDDCVAGDVCILLSQIQNLTQCRGFCRVDGDCKNGGKCLFGLQGGNLKVCSDMINNCGVVPQMGCAMGTSCFVNTPDGQSGCHAAGPGGQCAACNTDYDCKGGFKCFGGSNACGGPGCVPLCRKGVNGDCPNGFTCKPVIYDQQMDQWANWGACDL